VIVTIVTLTICGTVVGATLSSVLNKCKY
jgi:hypothetical protein